MRMRFLMMLAAPLFGGHGICPETQDNPIQNPGDIPPSGYGDTVQGQVDCTDPLMAASSQCSGAQGGALQSGGLINRAPSGLYSPYSPNGRTTNYSDQTGMTASQRARSTMIPLPPEPLTEFQKFTASTTGMVLPIFGANLFQSVPSTFAPLDNAPVPPDYVIGPDDTLRVRVWGQVNLNANVRVDRSGDIFIPQVGAVHVAGVRIFRSGADHPRTRCRKIYRNFQLIGGDSARFAPSRCTSPARRAAPASTPSVRSAPWSMRCSPAAAPRCRARCATSNCGAAARPSSPSTSTGC